MSYWAELDPSNKVIRVLAGDNNEPDEGESFMNSLGGTWVKTSFNSSIRKNYAGIGFSYDLTRDAFIPPKCHDLAILDEATCRWTCEDSFHEATFI